MLNKVKLSLLSVSTLALLAACGNNTQTEDPAVEEPVVEEPAGTTDDTADDMAGDAIDDTAGDTTDDTADNMAGDATGEAPDTTSGISNVTFSTTLEDAVQTFLDTFGVDVNIDEVDFDEDNNTYTYDISGWNQNTEYEMEIDANTGDIIKQESDMESDQDETDVIDFDAILSPQEAMDIAENEYDTGVIIEGWKLEVDDGVTVYEIDSDGVLDDDLEINAETGDVVGR